MSKHAAFLLALIAATAAAAPAPSSAPPAAPAASTASAPVKPAPASKPSAPAAAPATQPGRVARTTDLRDKPANDGAMLKVVQANTAVEVAERQGGWYKVTVDGAAGWMRLSAIRFGAPVASNGSSSGASALTFLQSGRSAVTKGTVTTGVRGLSEEGLSKAEPDYPAVASLDALAVSADDARGYAGELAAAPMKIEYIKVPERKDDKKRKKGGG